MQPAVIPEVQTIQAEAQIGTRVRALRTNGCAHVFAREAQKLSDQRHVDIERIDSFIGVDGLTAQVRCHSMPRQGVHAGELPQNACDRFVRLQPSWLEHEAKTRTEHALVEDEDGQRHGSGFAVSL